MFSLPGRAAHAHFCAAGSLWERIHVLFRDYLRSHQGARAAYQAHKYELAVRYPDDRVAYTAGKTMFVGEMVVAAEEWAAATGWELR